VHVIRMRMMKGAGVCMIGLGIVLSNQFLLDLGSGLMPENKARMEGQEFLK
jgi:hypothetical protein